MRYTRTLIPTLKEAPVDAATVSHVLLTRAGYVRRVGAGIYSFLPLGLRVLARIERIVREQMDAAGALEVRYLRCCPQSTFARAGAGISSARRCCDSRIARAVTTIWLRPTKRSSWTSRATR